jgi:hypothetical protein
VKQRATGHGDADKSDVRLAAQRYLGRLPGPDAFGTSFSLQDEGGGQTDARTLDIL